MKKILIVCSGMSPQVLTETLYALVTAENGTCFIPDEVHLISTHNGAEQARLNLLEGNQHFYRFCKDYDYDETAFDATRIHTVTDGHGNALDDIRTPQDNEAMADFVMNFVRSIATDPDCAIHMSMAGGRKTMGYYCGYAMSLFGRSQDVLSHVLVSEGFEGNPDFYYPTPKPVNVYGRENKMLDASEARIMLAEIPFVRLRESLPNTALLLESGFVDTVNISQKATQPAHLRIDTANSCLHCSGIPVFLSAAYLALYIWLLKNGPAKRSDLDGGPVSKSYADSFIAEYRSISGEMGAQDRVVDAQNYGLLDRYVEANKSALNRDLREQLGNQLAQLYEIKTGGKRGSSYYHIALSEDQIEGM